jgi:hypothetical protein
MKPARLLFAALLTPPAVMAGGGSANYSLTPDTVDSGGLRGASASYSVNASTTAGGAGSSAGYTARTGFDGQLLDATGLVINASPQTVIEGGTRQLSASLLYDDSTTTLLPANTVAWSVQSGPLASVSATGLATAAPVYQDTTATARANYQSFTTTLNLTVLDANPDNFGSYAGDGISDDWQVQYFGINNPAAGPLQDPDGDGYNNLFEYNARLVPTDRLSVFTFQIIDTTGGGHAVRFSPRLPGSTYTVTGSSNLSLWTPVAGLVTDSGTLRTVLDPAGTGAPRFYFISVLRDQ